MKRIHLFEFEDFRWFPNWLRISLTRLMVVMHKLLGTNQELLGLVRRALTYSAQSAIVDLCSGSGGAMVEVVKTLKKEPGLENLRLTLTDLYPNQELASQINQDPSGDFTYLTTPVDATNVPNDLAGLRTMVCSFHHMTPSTAKNILKNVYAKRQPICIYEISDNSFPILLWWIAIPLNFIMALFITPLVRALTWQQLVFTYLIPVIPFFFAWDGAVSNARTYTLKDLDILLEGLDTEDYRWEKGTIAGKAKKMYLLGFPVTK